MTTKLSLENLPLNTNESMLSAIVLGILRPSVNFSLSITESGVSRLRSKKAEIIITGEAENIDLQTKTKELIYLIPKMIKSTVSRSFEEFSNKKVAVQGRNLSQVDLRAAMSVFGKVHDAYLIGKSRKDGGLDRGYVVYESIEDARDAISAKELQLVGGVLMINKRFSRTKRSEYKQLGLNSSKIYKPMNFRKGGGKKIGERLLSDLQIMTYNTPPQPPQSIQITQFISLLCPLGKRDYQINQVDYLNSQLSNYRLNMAERH